MSDAAATNPARPTLWRQCTATFLPPANKAVIRFRIVTKFSIDSGTPRSGIGKERNCNPLDSTVSDSYSSPSCPASSLSSKETTTSTPASRQPAVSSSSQSPPRGRLDTASFPDQGPGIQKRSGIIAASSSRTVPSGRTFLATGLLLALDSRRLLDPARPSMVKYSFG